MPRSHDAPPETLDRALEVGPGDWQGPAFYQLMTALVIPRPIGWISTISAKGVRNIAPYSYFNLMGSDPFYVAFGSTGVKDSLANLREVPEFVANIVTMDLLERMNFTSGDFPRDEDEFAWADLTPVAAAAVRPFRVGERVRLQAGPLGGITEGVVSSLGLLYTTLARGEDRIMIPNSVVLSAAIVPLREPEQVNVKVRIGAGIRPSQVQAILDQSVGTPTRAEPRVLLEEIDGGDIVVRVQATPERESDGGRLADEIIAALASVTGEHRVSLQ